MRKKKEVMPMAVQTNKGLGFGFLFEILLKLADLLFGIGFD